MTHTRGFLNPKVPRFGTCQGRNWSPLFRKREGGGTRDEWLQKNDRFREITRNLDLEFWFLATRCAAMSDRADVVRYGMRSWLFDDGQGTSERESANELLNDRC